MPMYRVQAGEERVSFGDRSFRHLCDCLGLPVADRSPYHVPAFILIERIERCLRQLDGYNAREFTLSEGETISATGVPTWRAGLDIEYLKARLSRLAIVAQEARNNRGGMVEVLCAHVPN